MDVKNYLQIFEGKFWLFKVRKHLKYLKGHNGVIKSVKLVLVQPRCKEYR